MIALLEAGSRSMLEPDCVLDTGALSMTSLRVEHEDSVNKVDENCLPYQKIPSDLCRRSRRSQDNTLDESLNQNLF